MNIANINDKPIPYIIHAEKALFALSISLLPRRDATTIEPPTPNARPGICTMYIIGTHIEDADNAVEPIKFPISIASNSDVNCIAKIVNMEGIRY